MGVPKQLSVNAEAFAAVTSQKPQSNNPFFFDDIDTGAPSALSGISEADKQKALEEEQNELNVSLYIFLISECTLPPGWAVNPFQIDPSPQITVIHSGHLLILLVSGPFMLN